MLKVLNNLFYYQIQKTVSEQLAYSNDLIDSNQSTAENQKKKERKPKRLLIAEPDSDIHVLYSLFTKHSMVFQYQM